MPGVGTAEDPAAATSAATSEVLALSGEFDSGALHFGAAERIAVRARPSHIAEPNHVLHRGLGRRSVLDELAALAEALNPGFWRITRSPHPF